MYIVLRIILSSCNFKQPVFNSFSGNKQINRTPSLQKKNSYQQFLNNFCQKIPQVVSLQECATKCVIPFSTLVHEDVVKKQKKRAFSNHFVHGYPKI